MNCPKTKHEGEINQTCVSYKFEIPTPTQKTNKTKQLGLSQNT